MRGSGYERELDIVPIGANGVVDYGPALEDGGVGAVFGGRRGGKWISRRALR